MYPERCEKSVSKISRLTGTNKDTAYAMLLMTAMLMDLHPEDEDVLRMVLEDCGVVDLCES